MSVNITIEHDFLCLEDGRKSNTIASCTVRTRSQNIGIFGGSPVATEPTGLNRDTADDDGFSGASVCDAAGLWLPYRSVCTADHCLRLNSVLNL